MKVTQLLESADPPHSHVAKNDEQDLFVQVIPASHHTNNRPAGVDKYKNGDEWTEVPHGNIRFRPNGRVILIGKRNGWPQQAARVFIDYENIDDVIQALQSAKKKLEDDHETE